jgi:hypothetical protein
VTIWASYCFFGELGQPEIKHFHLAFVADHDVGGFDVPVNDSR